MSAAAAASPVAVLRHAALLTGLLAVIAGFLGMHILSGSHGSHGQASPGISIERSPAHTAGQAPSGDTAVHPDGHPATALPELSRRHTTGPLPSRPRLPWHPPRQPSAEPRSRRRASARADAPGSLLLTSTARRPRGAHL